MLVLSRKVGERIFVGNDVVVTLVRIGPNAVRIGIKAPKGVEIIREELIETPCGGGKIQEDEEGIAELGRRN